MIAPIPEKEPELKLEEGSANVTLQDTYKMLYVLVKQSQNQHPGSVMSFDLKAFKCLPKNLKLNFQQKDGKLFVWIPEKRDRKKKSNLLFPRREIITLN